MVHGTGHNVTMNDLSQRVEIEHSASVKDEEVRNQLAYNLLFVISPYVAIGSTLKVSDVGR